jgi:hypothetical protein
LIVHEAAIVACTVKVDVVVAASEALTNGRRQAPISAPFKKSRDFSFKRAPIRFIDGTIETIC